MANSTSTTLASLYTNILASALYTAQEKAVIRPLVREYNLVGQPGKTAQVPVWPAQATSGVTTGEASDISSDTTITTTTKEIATDEVAIMATLTDTARDSSAEDAAAGIGRILGETLARKVDEDLSALFQGFSTTVGDYSTELTPDLIFKAVAELRTNSVMGPYHCVVAPKAAYNLKKVLTNAGYSTSSNAMSDLGNEALRQGFFGSIAGVNFFESAVVGTSASGDSAGTASCAVFTPEALGLAMKKDITIETQRDASLRAEEIVASMTYGVLEIKDGEGVLIKTDALTSN